MTATPLLTRISEGKARKDPPKLARMSPFVRRLAEKRLPAKVLWNGAWTEPDQGGAA